MLVFGLSFHCCQSNEMVGNVIVKPKQDVSWQNFKVQDFKFRLTPIQRTVDHRKGPGYVQDGSNQLLGKGILMIGTNSRKQQSLRLILAFFDKYLSIENSAITIKVAYLSMSQSQTPLFKSFLCHQFV